MNNTIHFFAPSFKRYETEEYSNSRNPIFASISITEKRCELMCEHCQARLLESVYYGRSPDNVWRMAVELHRRGCQGLLITGGCDREGRLPAVPYATILNRIKQELGLTLAVHTKLLDEPLAEALAASNVDVIMLDVVGSTETLRSVYHLETKSVSDVIHSLELLDRYRLAAAPHIVIGLHYGEIKGEFEALQMLRARALHALVLVVVNPLRRTPMASISPPSLDVVKDIFIKARAWFPDTPLLLGCARPSGAYQHHLDQMALDSGVDGIAYPAEGIVARSRELGLAPVFSEHCCALIDGKRA
jgi:uncharacterized radical SAM superfamily protein